MGVRRVPTETFMLYWSVTVTYTCNSILAAVLPKFQLHQIQSVLNCEAIVLANKHSHISEYIMRDKLNRFPVAKSIAFKTIMLRRTSIVGIAPAYIRDLCVTVLWQLGRLLLRSVANGEMQVPHCLTLTRAHRAFVCVGSSWNLHTVAFDFLHINFC